MPLPEKHICTIDDIYDLPDGVRGELINGKMYMMAPPGRIHQEISQYLSMMIGSYIMQHHGTCKIYPAPFAVFLNQDDFTYVEPDISVICDHDKLNDKGCQGAPDWVIEIVSPSSKTMDYYRKLALYQSAGVREYWIVDPMKEIILVYNMEYGDAPVIYFFQNTISSFVIPGLNIDFSHLTLK
ncbi:MAG: Uma2 family endonuclease [Lachnospiraceae bacterium]|nr:Uma2 family endonuclease [Lachnospiraceae bacterium]